MTLEIAREVADAVLYEGYVLYPYRKSAAKNQARWQWGVLMPPLYAAGGTGENAHQRTECLAEPRDGDTLTVVVRFLHLQRRQVERAGDDGVFDPVEELGGELTWDEAVEREVAVDLDVADLLCGAHEQPFAFEAAEAVTPVPDGRVVRSTQPVTGHVRVQADPLDGPFGGVRLQVQVHNDSACPSGVTRRDDAVPFAMVGTHTLLGLELGRFVSMVDPPQWAKGVAEACTSEHTWPVLVGDQRRVVLSSPIILPDQPQIAPESPGTWYDGLEIDELLVLRTQTLTDAEKDEARRTDPRAAAIIDRADHLPDELRDRLHGAIRSIEDLNGDADPQTDTIRIGDADVGRGTRVALNPGTRRADAQDMFLVGRLATVEAVLFDLDDKPYLAVTIDDDPGAEMQKAHGRFLYFAPDEVMLPGVRS